jgi:hypothetical protein
MSLSREAKRYESSCTFAWDATGASTTHPAKKNAAMKNLREYLNIMTRKV